MKLNKKLINLMEKIASWEFLLLFIPRRENTFLKLISESKKKYEVRCIYDVWFHVNCFHVSSLYFRISNNTRIWILYRVIFIFSLLLFPPYSLSLSTFQLCIVTENVSQRLSALD